MQLFIVTLELLKDSTPLFHQAGSTVFLRLEHQDKVGWGIVPCRSITSHWIVTAQLIPCSLCRPFHNSLVN